MALSTYSDIKVALLAWSERTDLSETLLEDFIRLAESDASQQLRVPAMESATKLVVTSGRVTIPFDFLELRRLTWEGTQDQVLQYLPWDQFVEVNRGHPGTQPLYYSRQGPIWYISGEPGDGSEVLCHYYNYIPELNSTTQVTNWLLDMSPTVYLFGGLKYVYEYLMDVDRAAYWGGRFDKELNKLQAIADLAEHRGSSLSVKTI